MQLTHILLVAVIAAMALGYFTYSITLYHWLYRWYSIYSRMHTQAYLHSCLPHLPVCPNPPHHTPAAPPLPLPRFPESWPN